jgi:hypothetical protein
MTAVRQWHNGYGLDCIIAAWSLAALMLGVSTSAAASYKAAPRSEQRMAVESPGSSPVLSAQNSAASTLQVPSAAVGSDDDESPQTESSTAASPCADCDPDSDTLVGEAEAPNDETSYQAGSSDFDFDGVSTSWIGLSLSRDRRRLISGGYACGLLVVAVEAASPAAYAGLQPPIEGKARKVVEMATLAAGMAFAPALIGAAIVNSTRLDESYDMIIGIDGDRIMKAADLEDHLCAVRPGEIVYLNMVRSGLRLQVPVSIPTDMATPYCTSVSHLAPR